MKKVKFGKSGLHHPAVVVGGMRLNKLSVEEMNHFVHSAVEQGAYYFDYADIYGGGECEELFGRAIAGDTSIRRSDLFLQSKCGIRQGWYDLSKEHILESVDGILKRFQTDYLDMLLLHRPDALYDPSEIAEAFYFLEKLGKVKNFGVSNFKPSQIELMKRDVRQPILVNQLQYSIPVSNMVAQGLEVNMDTPGSFDHDGSVMDYCRLNDITVQAWSPFQMPNWKGCFIGSEEYGPLNDKLKELAEKYNTTPTGIATAWIVRHPARMQVVSGTTSEQRLTEMIQGSDIVLTAQEWYELYLAAGHILP